MSEWFGEPVKELPQPDDAQRQRLRELALSQEWNDSLSTAAKEFARKHNIELEEE